LTLTSLPFCIVLRHFLPRPSFSLLFSSPPPPSPPLSPLSLHDALPISAAGDARLRAGDPDRRLSHAAARLHAMEPRLPRARHRGRAPSARMVPAAQRAAALSAAPRRTTELPHVAQLEPCERLGRDRDAE